MALIRKDVIHIAGRVDGTTGNILAPPANQFREFNVTRLGVGIYQLFMDRALNENESAVFMSIEGVPAGVYDVFRNAGQPTTEFFILTFNAGGVFLLFDRTFSFKVLRIGG